MSLVLLLPLGFGEVGVEAGLHSLGLEGQRGVLLVCILIIIIILVLLLLFVVVIVTVDILVLILFILVVLIVILIIKVFVVIGEVGPGGIVGFQGRGGREIHVGQVTALEDGRGRSSRRNRRRRLEIFRSGELGFEFDGSAGHGVSWMGAERGCCLVALGREELLGGCKTLRRLVRRGGVARQPSGFEELGLVVPRVASVERSVRHLAGMFRACRGDRVSVHDLVPTHGVVGETGSGRDEEPVVGAAGGWFVHDGAIRGLPAGILGSRVVSRLGRVRIMCFFFIGEGFFVGSHGGRRQQVARARINVLFLLKINM